MDTCPNCGTAVSDEARFCSDCGADLNRQPDRTAPRTTVDAPDNPRTEPSSADESIGNATPGSRTDDAETIAGPSPSWLAGLSRTQRIVLVGSALTVIGAFLPWATVFGTSISGLRVDGVFTLGLAVIAAGIAYFRPLDGRNVIAAAIGGALIVIIGVVDLTGVSGIGLYLTIIGGLVIGYPAVEKRVG